MTAPGQQLALDLATAANDGPGQVAAAWNSSVSVDCQTKYESMVETRLTRDARSSADLGKIRGTVMRAVARYTNALLTMLDEQEPESLEVVLAALRPLELLRASSAPTSPNSTVPAAEGEVEGVTA